MIKDSGSGNELPGKCLQCEQTECESKCYVYGRFGISVIGGAMDNKVTASPTQHLQMVQLWGEKGENYVTVMLYKGIVDALVVRGERLVKGKDKMLECLGENKDERLMRLKYVRVKCMDKNKQKFHRRDWTTH